MKNSGFDKENFPEIDFSGCCSVIINDFLDVLNGKTLGAKVSDAIELRSKGMFNDAMLLISEINRDQVLAIRDIQKIIDKYEGKERTEVILDKFRQKFPFQIGLVNGDDVIKLLSNNLKSLATHVDGLHKNETKIIAFREELLFYQTRMAGRIPESEVANLCNTVSAIDKDIISAKEYIINVISSFVFDAFQNADIEDKVTVVKNLFLIQTSSIETLPTEDVDTDGII